MNCKNLAKIALSVLLASGGALVTPVYAENETSNTTQINYEVSEAYEWMAPVDFSFTQNSNGSEAHTATVKVIKNVIGANKTLKISIANGQEFALTDASNPSNKRTYTVKDGSTDLSVGSEILAVPSGTNTGSKDMQVQMDSQAVEVAGTYAGTLKFTSSLSSSYRIEYHLDGGDNDPGNPSSYTSESGDITLAEATKEGYVFAGWYTEPELTNPVTTIVKGTEGNVDLYAKWIIASYTINYVLNGGTNNASNPAGYDVTNLPIALATPTKSGCTFAGWYDNEQFSGSPVTEITAGSTGDRRFYAKWNTETYTISYDLDGGSFESTEITSYTVDDLPMTLQNPAKEGYTFLGWTGSNGDTPEKDLQITAADIGSKQYTANWEVKVVAATFHDYDLGAEVGLSWTELKQASNGTKYSYDAGAVTDTSIGDSAFQDCYNLTSITIPDSVTSISDYAFSDCSLTSITIPDSVTSISDYAFSDCGCLTSIVIPYNVTSIGNYAFSNCGSLTSITIPDSVRDIGNYAFQDCCNLTSITIPARVTSIGNYGFGSCHSLTSITIPDNNSVTSISDYAFSDCESLKRLNSDTDGVFNIPDGVTSIGDYAFSYCGSLTSITIPDSVTSISDYAFSNCGSLTSITIPDGVTSISDYAFWNCGSLTSIAIPDSVTSIGVSAFYECNSLTSITVPDSVTSIGDSAFQYCYNLTSITFNGTQEEWNSIAKGSDWDNSTDNYTVHCTDGDIVKGSTSTTSAFSSRANSIFAPITNFFAKLFA